MGRENASRWYLLAAAALLLALAALDRPLITLAAAACGLVVGLVLAARGRLGRISAVGMIGFGLAAALALFNLWRGH